MCRASTITSPALSSTGTIEIVNGTLRLTDSPLQLHDGTLTGGTLEALAGPLGGAIVLPSGNRISSIATGKIDLADGGASIENQGSGNALASLSSIGPNGTLIDESSLAVTGSLTAQGTLQVLGTLDVPGNLVTDGLFQADGADVTGDYTQTSAGTLTESFGPTGADIIAPMSVGKTATLSGTLDIGVRRTCTPQDGTTATAMTFAARTGTFTTTGPGFTVAYGPTSVQVQYTGPVNRTGCGPGG